MPKENERMRRYKKKESEPIKINYRLFIFTAFVIIAVIIKIMPSSVLKDYMTKLSKTNTDFPQMFSEIASVIKKHTLSNDGFSMPVSGVITSPFGTRKDPISGEETSHLGIDINAPLNTEIGAAKNGIVTRAETNEYYGNFIMIDHGDNTSSLYGHLNEIKVSVGDEVKKSQIIALSGDSGKSTGPHLHFEIRKDNIHSNPLDFIEQ